MPFGLTAIEGTHCASVSWIEEFPLTIESVHISD